MEEHFRKLSLKEGTLPNSSFQMDPPTSLVDLFFEKEGATNTRQKVSLDEEDNGVVNLANYEPNCSYSVEIFSRGTQPRLLLHKFRFSKSTDGSIDIHYVDVAATVIETIFNNEDKPVIDAEVSGEFKGANGQSCSLKGRTGENGSFIVVLPQGTVSKFKAKKGSEEYTKNYDIPIPAPVSTPGNLRRKSSIMIEIKPSSFGSAVAPTRSDAKIAILGDISGSMGAAGQMEILRKSYIDVFDKATKNGWPVVMGAWDSSPVEWCYGGNWIPSSQRETVRSWATSLQARGGNDMQRAISEAIQRNPSLTDVYTMCDGDVSPFNIETWRVFRSKYPHINFHFIALGRGADFKTMNEMATCGNGTFWESNL